MAIKWMKTGADSVQAAQKEAAIKQQQADQKGKLFDYWMKKGEDGSITFVDGALNEDGVLAPSRYWEHSLHLNGTWGHTYVCPEQTNPASGEKCPICESGDKPYLVSLFTVIDHRTFPSKDGTKIYKDTRKLFPVKSGTFEKLNKLALKRGGLAGCTFDVSRSMDEKSPRVGDLFDFTSKEEDLDVLRAKYTRSYKDKDGKEVTVCDFEPAIYDEEIVYRGEEELRKLGFGKPPVGGSMPNAVSKKPAGVDYSSQL